MSGLRQLIQTQPPKPKATIVLDSVLDYDASSGRTSNGHNEEVVSYCTEHSLDVKYILESHVHADHLTGASFLKERFPSAMTGIGERVREVQTSFASIFNLSQDDLAQDGSQFDVLFSDGDTFELGQTECRVINTPGHTPACVCYVIGNAVFAGDTLFMPDFGTARCDFPGGSSSDLYASIRRLYDELPDDARVFVGHDYQPGGRELLFQTSIGEEKKSNKQLKDDTSAEEFTLWRTERDSQLGFPKLMIPALQVNLRNGKLPPPESSLPLQQASIWLQV